MKPNSDDNLLCACNGLPCKGICREIHLHGKQGMCPAAYKKEQKYRKPKEKEKQIRDRKWRRQQDE